MSKILWVDDRYDLVENWIHACEALGHTVFYAPDEQASIKLVRKNGASIDLALFDQIMPGTGGCALAEKLRPMMPNARQAIISSYNDVDIPSGSGCDSGMIPLIDRTLLPLPGEEEAVGEFVTKLVSGQVKGILHTGTKRNIFDITYDEYLLESLEGRLGFNEEAQREPCVKKLLEKRDFYWLFVCGDLVHKSPDPGGVYSSRQINDIARNKNRAPYQFFADFDVDDLSPNKCRGDLSNYPVIRLEFSQDGAVDMHFDTGNPENFINYEKLEAQINTDTFSGVLVTIQGERFQAFRGSVEVLIEDPLTKATETFEDIEIIAVKQWEESRLVRERLCTSRGQDRCNNASEDSSNGKEGRYCRYRLYGLLGRRLQGCTKRFILISPTDGRVSLLESSEVDRFFREHDNGS